MSKKRRPRIFQQLYAWFFGYFWLPCPICKEYFGGHELGATLMTTWYEGSGVCIDCVKKAEKINKVNIEKWKPEMSAYYSKQAQKDIDAQTS